jgi:hypothetical protein
VTDNHLAWQSLNLEPLALLDLNKRRTVGEIVDGMSRCSFGARCLGEVAATLSQWATTSPPVIIYDGMPGTPLANCLSRMVANGRASRIVRQRHPCQSHA